MISHVSLSGGQQTLSESSASVKIALTVTIHNLNLYTKHDPPN